MNISTGGPHVLFFERDQQLTALLTSEFQLAGYECHAARTAVEVFDTIARFPVRVLLVNLAQAAAGRREFWVALDTQRRGRGVQVFTYLCSNLAGYGPRDSDERSQTQTADIEIDGMLGLMSMVDAVRERVPASAPVSTGTTNTQPRMQRVAPQAPPATPNIHSAPAAQGQNSTNTPTYRAGPIDSSGYPAPRANTTPPASTLNSQSYSEKIRAVLYPTQRPTNTQTMVPAQEVEPTPTYNEPQQYTQQNTHHTQNVSPNVQDAPIMQPQSQQAYDYDATALQRLAYGGTAGAGQESGLDQLSRLLQGRATPTSSDERPEYPQVRETRTYESDTRPTEQYAGSYTPTSQTTPTTEAIGSQILRASPIEDLPLERTSNGTVSDGVRRVETRVNYRQHGQTTQAQSSQATPLASISRASIAPSVPPQAQAQPPISKATMPVMAVSPPPQNVVAPQPISTTQEERINTEKPTSQQVEEHRTAQQAVKETLVEYEGQDRNDESEEEEQTRERPIAQRSEVEEEHEEREHDMIEMTRGASEQLLQATMPMLDSSAWKDMSETGMSPNNAILLDIVQSLPLMPSPPPQPPTPQAVSGRTMRTLGSVLLEGHLVPQNRLEVAQNIQRMLRGVDLNYQLGEILLMFKLLTPDQLLAASLVSYGMISTQQISALGRIRQELHAIGLEYDLESLLILFRMLTPEQLREVRSSWQG